MAIGVIRACNAPSEGIVIIEFHIYEALQE
jgi:hypothetical protein